MKKINWLDHIANLLVVILGISIAFYLEGYRQEQSNKLQERKYLQSLLEDIETDIEKLDTLISFNDEIKTALINLSDMSVRRTSFEQLYSSDTAFIRSLSYIRYNPPFSSQGSSYESLKASGKMELIADFELRNQIVELYEQYYQGTAEYDQAIKELVRDFVSPYYMNEIRFSGAWSVDHSFLYDGKFQNMIFTYRYLFLAKDEFYRAVREESVDLREELKRYLLE